jgi:hypothetical protein
LAPLRLSAPKKVATNSLASVALQTDTVAHTAAEDRRDSHKAASSPAAARAAVARTRAGAGSGVAAGAGAGAGFEGSVTTSVRDRAHEEMSDALDLWAGRQCREVDQAGAGAGEWAEAQAGEDEELVAGMEMMDVDAHVKLVSGCVAIGLCVCVCVCVSVYLCVCMCVCVDKKEESDVQRKRWATLCACVYVRMQASVYL